MENNDVLENIVYLDKDCRKMSEEELFELISNICNPIQVDIIMKHIYLLTNRMLIGYDKLTDDVYVLNLDDENLLKINKKKD